MFVCVYLCGRNSICNRWPLSLHYYVLLYLYIVVIFVRTYVVSDTICIFHNDFISFALRSALFRFSIDSLFFWFVKLCINKIIIQCTKKHFWFRKTLFFCLFAYPWNNQSKWVAINSLEYLFNSISFNSTANVPTKCLCVAYSHDAVNGFMDGRRHSLSKNCTCLSVQRLCVYKLEVERDDLGFSPAHAGRETFKSSQIMIKL